MILQHPQKCGQVAGIPPQRFCIINKTAISCLCSIRCVVELKYLSIHHDPRQFYPCTHTDMYHIILRYTAVCGVYLFSFFIAGNSLAAHKKTIRDAIRKFHLIEIAKSIIILASEFNYN